MITRRRSLVFAVAALALALAGPTPAAAAPPDPLRLRPPGCNPTTCTGCLEYSLHVSCHSTVLMYVASLMLPACTCCRRFSQPPAAAVDHALPTHAPQADNITDTETGEIAADPCGSDGVYFPGKLPSLPVCSGHDVGAAAPHVCVP